MDQHALWINETKFFTLPQRPCAVKDGENLLWMGSPEVKKSTPLPRKGDAVRWMVNHKTRLKAKVHHLGEGPHHIAPKSLQIEALGNHGCSHWYANIVLIPDKDQWIIHHVYLFFPSWLLPPPPSTILYKVTDVFHPIHRGKFHKVQKDCRIRDAGTVLGFT